MNWCSTFRAERLWPSIPAFAGLDVDFQFTRKQLERVFPSVRDHPERGARQRLAVGAMADQGLGRVDLRLVGNVSAVTTAHRFSSHFLRTLRGTGREVWLRQRPNMRSMI